MKNLILIGFMGCGKSSLGVRLSYRLRCPLVDTDEWIERRQRRKIADIFAQEGEEAFRRMETELLQELLTDKGKRIIATGGGLPMREENRKLLRELGTVIYLRADPTTLYRRLKGDKNRPLLRRPNPEAEIDRLLRVRAPIYEAAADEIVDVDARGYAGLLDEICARLPRETEHFSGRGRFQKDGRKE